MTSRRDTDRFKRFSRRTALLAGGQGLLLSLLVGRMYYLQVVERDQYRLLAEENRIDLQLLAPPRGRVLDRYGNVIAGNQQNYQVLLVAEQAKGVDDVLARLSHLIPISENEYRRVKYEIGRKRDFVPVRVSENLSWEQFANVNVHSPDLPGVLPQIGERRSYPVGEAYAHVVGYVGAVSEQEQTGDPLLTLPGFRIGKTGIERAYDAQLRGKAGNSRVEVNAYGRVIRELQRDDGVPGADVALTVDSELQLYASNLLSDESAAAVVMDIHSGEVLAMASSPSFDPNLFNRGITTEEWRELTTNPRDPLVDKAISGQYPPGSTFKMIVALAALESGVANAGHSVTCTGSTTLGRGKFYCWRKYGHGRLAMLEAIEQSCDVYFYDLALRTGIDRIAEMARRFGYGQRLGIELPGERTGLVPDRDWKLAVHGVPWQKGETLISGIGQGYLLSTPLQLATMVARIANGSVAVTPRLVRGVARSPGAAADSKEEASAKELKSPPALGVSTESLGIVREGMRRVSNSRRGTAYRARIEDEAMALAGKTGTSQVRRITKAERGGRVLKNEERPWRERDHALFVAYAPVSAPRYAVAVVVEHGGSGSRAAAPLARDILLRTQQLDPIGQTAAADRTAPAGGTRRS